MSISLTRINKQDAKVSKKKAKGSAKTKRPERQTQPLRPWSSEPPPLADAGPKGDNTKAERIEVYEQFQLFNLGFSEPDETPHSLTEKQNPRLLLETLSSKLLESKPTWLGQLARPLIWLNKIQVYPKLKIPVPEFFTQKISNSVKKKGQKQKLRR